MSITKRTLKDGSTRYDVRVRMGQLRDGSTERVCHTVRTKKEAVALEAKLIAEREARRGKSGKMSLATYISTYYAPIASKRLAATSWDTYQIEISRRILPALGDLDIRDIDRRDIQWLVDSIPTKSVARKMIGTLKTILNEAKSDGIIRANPATAKFAMPPDGSKRDNGLVLTDFEQIDSFCSIVAQTASQRLQRVVFTGLYQGLRPEERYALDWCDFDMEDFTLTVNSAYVCATGGAVMKSTKTAMSMRTIPMHPKFREWLVNLPSGQGAFIVNEHGERLNPSTAKKQWTRYLDSHPELPRLTLENMRHSFSTAYLASGGRIEVLSKLLGHTNIQTTINRYFRPDVDTLRGDVF